MIWTSLDTWIVITGILTATACALLGNFLVLQRLSMMGDAISHAVLPGIALAFLYTGSRASFPMFIGAAVAGVLTALFTQWIHRFAKVDQDASMGVVFTALFAIGLIIIVRAADAVDLDPGCVLYGAIELVPLDVVPIGPWLIPRAVVVLSAVVAVNLLFVVGLFKELKVCSFDPELATTMGISATFMHYLLMILVAITAVAAFESVGSILVIAMLIVPPSAAFLLTHRLHMMIIISVVIGLLSAVFGHMGAQLVPPMLGFDTDTTTAGMMALATGMFFAAAVLFAPRQGVVAKLTNQIRLSLRITREDVLGLLYRVEELNPTPQQHVHRAQFPKALHVSRTRLGLALRALLRSGKIQSKDERYHLTESGRSDARNLVRSHRLWETYLVRFLNLPSDHVHSSAERLEHVTDRTMRQELAENAPETDPQGKHIPPEGEEKSS